MVESLEGRVLLTGRPPGNTGTGFYVVGSNIYDANGNQFVIRGINQTEAWGDPTTNFAALSEFPKTQANAVRVIFTPGLGDNSPSEHQQVAQQLISEGIVPIVEDNGAASRPSVGALNAVVNRWLDPANVAWLKQDEKYVILDIAGEWGQPGPTWAQGYESAIARLRAAGINCLLMIVAPGGGSNVDSILTWGQQILNSDPQHNVVFSIHMYAAWTTEQNANLVGTVNGRLTYDTLTELQKVEAADLPLVIGEFSSDSSGSVNYSTQRAMQIYQSLDLGWIAWSWNGNTDDPAQDMVATPGYQYNSDADLTPFGNLIVKDPNYGLKATSLRASIFPPGVAVERDSNMETTQAGGTAQFTVSLDSPPAANVTIPLSSSDTTQGTVSPASLTFTPADWNVTQIVTVTGVNNGIAGSNTVYSIATGPTVSQDPNYNGLNPSAASLTNVNTDGPVQIVADGAAGWSQVGPWIPSGPGGGYQGGASHSLPAGTGANTITWSFPVAPGLYQIESTWTAASSLADNAPYTILNNGTQIGMLRVDQQVAHERYHGQRRQLEGPGQLLGQRRDPAGAALGRRRRHRHRRCHADRKPDEYQCHRGRNGLAAVGARERNDRPGLHLHARTGSLAGPLTAAFGVGGTAAFGTDYNETGAASFGATSGTVTFAAGSATATVTLNPIVDGVADGNETAVLTLSAGTGYAIGLPSSATGTISDAQVSLAVSPASVPENGSTGLVYTFTRTGSLVGPLTVSFGVGGTAAFGTDYTQSGAVTFGATSGTVTIPNGSATATVILKPIAANSPDPDETAILTVSYGTGYEPVSPRAATGTFTDASPTDPRALQVPGTPSRIAAVWYSATSFTVDVNLGDGAGHNLELYFDDWDNWGRAETVQISNATSGAVLSTQTISSFQSGKYMDYAVSGNILITITNNGPANAVLNGLFLDPATAGSGTTATFLQYDTTTQGTWIGTYGASGYDIVTGPTSLPAGDTVSPAGQSTYTWPTSNVFVNVVSVPTWVTKYGPNNLVYTFSRAGSTAEPLTVAFTVGGTAVLGTDYTESGADSFGATSGTITIPAGSATASVVLAPIDDNPLEPDVTAVLTVSGSSEYNLGPYANATGTISDSTQDFTTEGNWIGTYGSSGYAIVSGPTSLPVRRHGHARRPVDLHLDHRLHRHPRLAGPRLAYQPRRRRLVLDHQLQRRRRPRRRTGARPRAVPARLGQQRSGRDGADHQRGLGRRAQHSDDLVVPIGRVPGLRRQRQHRDHDHPDGRGQRRPQRPVPRPRAPPRRSSGRTRRRRGHGSAPTARAATTSSPARPASPPATRSRPPGSRPTPGRTTTTDPAPYRSLAHPTASPPTGTRPPASPSTSTWATGRSTASSCTSPTGTTLVGPRRCRSPTRPRAPC